MAETFHRLLQRFPVFVQFGIVFEGSGAEVAYKTADFMESMGWGVYFNPNAGEVGTVLKVYVTPVKAAENCLAFDLLGISEIVSMVGVTPQRYEWDFFRPGNSGLEIACSREDDCAIGVKEKWGFGRRHPKRQGKVLPNTSGRMVDFPEGTPLISRENNEPYAWKGFTPLYLWTRMQTAASKIVRDAVFAKKRALGSAGRMDRVDVPRPDYDEAFWRITTRWEQESVSVSACEVDSSVVPTQLLPDKAAV